ncbi:predicted protein [Sclerotinia sclerotiorum 1980 UF-70]|uniref:Uncharacterized protein n=1 Tax=Sclerotinia sclerotiorum (strain ATCC 18683 / 1980 / Ss-1) TaxID=665079 RepID=A7EEF5_SCLS1|nr:predicted protein [Sclerotinia sclerotiorum 1980 UF-70]EDO01221.1 predicted protein [Sclerotinia sclerotiorum 1980 UF-70]
MLSPIVREPSKSGRDIILVIGVRSMLVRGSTSPQDSHSEAQNSSVRQTVPKRQTTIMSAHCLTSFQNSDAVLLFDGGAEASEVHEWWWYL